MVLFACLWSALIAADIDLGDDPLVPYRNQPVLSVDIDAPPGNDPNELLALIDIAPGNLLSQGDIEQAIKRIYALGRFSQVEVYAERQSGVVLLHVLVSPLARLDDIEIVNRSRPQNIATAALRAALDINAGDEVDRRTPGRLQARALAHLQRVGFPRGQVLVEKRDAGEGRVTFVLQVREGSPRRVRRIQFVGDTRLPPQILFDMLGTHPGSVLNLDALAHDVQLLRDAYLEHGFLRVQVAKPRVERSVEESDAGDAVDITFDVQAGDRSTLAFTGNTVFSEVDLRAQWPDPKGFITPTNLRIFRQRLVRLYRRAGYPLARITPRIWRDSAARTRRYLFIIDEGRPVEVTQVTFPGVRALLPELFNEQLAVVLRRELADDPVFSRLRAFDRAGPDPAPWRQLAPAPPVMVAPERRWNADLYQEAADQIAAAYHDMGYLNAEVGRPRLIPEGGKLGDPLCPPPPSQRRIAASQPRRACAVRVEIPVEEGAQTFIESVGFAGNDALAAATLLSAVEQATADGELSAAVTPGAALSQSRVEDGRIALIRQYRDLGYLYVRAFVRVDTLAGPWARVNYTIEEGPQVRVQRVLVRGNRYTREGVVRSRITLKPGDLYRLEQAVADQRSIAGLGVFSSVRVKLIDEEHASPRKDVVADVVERSRQPIELVPGISTTNGPRLRASYSHLNVLGTATAFTAAIKLNRQVFFGLFGSFASELEERYASYQGIDQLTKALEREIRLGLRSPPLRALPFDPLLRLDLVDQRVNAVIYSLDSETAILGVDMLMGHGFKGSLEGSIGLTDLECSKSNPDCNQSVDLRHQQNRPIDVGDLWTLKGGPLLIWDHRDSPINPTRGVFASLRYTYAIGASRPNSAALFEPLAFAKYEAALTSYIPIWHLVLAIAARAGTIDVIRSQVPIDQRFFMGGRDTLRGYVESTLIPQDACVAPSRPAGCAQQIQPIAGGPPLSQGGNTFLLLKTELRIPVIDNIFFTTFVDLGNLWVDFFHSRPFAVRMGTGVGLRYSTPVGALAVDFGINPAPRLQNGEAQSQLHFSIGAF